MYKLFLIEEYSPQTSCWPTLIRKNKTGLSVNEITNKYKGFEGELISSQFLAENESMHSNDIIGVKRNKCDDLLFVCNVSKNEKIPTLIQNNFLLIGYDFGICEEEQTIYSSIFNEILFGSIDELVSCKSFLNEYYLFSNESLAQSYEKLHRQLSLEGKDTENEAMSTYSIWKASSNDDINEMTDEIKASSTKYLIRQV